MFKCIFIVDPINTHPEILMTLMRHLLLRKELIAKGYKDAFVVAFKGKEQDY